MEIVMAAGGEEHSIALASDGRVWTFGNNEEGQCGVGDTFGDYKKAVREDPTLEQKNMNYIRFFKRPELLDTLPEGAKVTNIFAGKHYCQVLNKETNELYSWGMGDNYVLGTRDDENMYLPNLVHPKMFYEAKVRHVGCGDAHVVVLCSKDQDDDEEPMMEQVAVQSDNQVEESKDEKPAIEVVEEQPASQNNKPQTQSQPVAVAEVLAVPQKHANNDDVVSQKSGRSARSARSARSKGSRAPSQRSRGSKRAMNAIQSPKGSINGSVDNILNGKAIKRSNEDVLSNIQEEVSQDNLLPNVGEDNDYNILKQSSEQRPDVDI